MFETVMSSHSADRPVIVFDVLGTLVDQEGSLRKQVSAVTGWGEVAANRVVGSWLDHVAEQERAITNGDAAFAPSHILDAVALERLAADEVLPAEAIRPLFSAAQRLEPWSDTVEGLTKLATDVTVVGLSNASRRVLTGLSSSSGMRWHQVLSAEDAQTYKPNAEIYQVALSATPMASGAPYMVAAHAWDLRAAAAAGMRTAYVPRPNGDPPADSDAFDLCAEDLIDLHAKLRT